MIQIYDTSLPEDWIEKPLAQMVQLRRGYTWTKESEIECSEDGTVPVVRIPNVQNRLDLTDLLYLRDVSPDALEKAAVTKGWILFVGSNGTQDRIGDSVLMDEDREMVFASFLMGMTSKDHDKLLPEFLASWMRIQLVHEWFSKTSQQTTGLANYSWGAVKKLPLRFPSNVSEQRRIAAVLKLADDAIVKAKAELEATRELKRALENALLTGRLGRKNLPKQKTKAGELPHNWNVAPLKFVAVIDSGITLNQDRVPKDNPCRYLTVAHIQRAIVSSEEPRYLELSEVERETRLLAHGDLLVVEGHANSFEIGRTAMFEGFDEPTTYQNHLFRVRSDVQQLLPKFLLYVLNSERVQRHWSAICNTSSGLNTINRRNLRNLLVQFPETTEQRRILDSLEAGESSVTASEQKLIALHQVKKSLLQNLLTGKIRIPEGVLNV